MSDDLNEYFFSDSDPKLNLLKVGFDWHADVPRIFVVQSPVQDDGSVMVELQLPLREGITWKFKHTKPCPNHDATAWKSCSHPCRICAGRNEAEGFVRRLGYNANDEWLMGSFHVYTWVILWPHNDDVIVEGHPEGDFVISWNFETRTLHVSLRGVQVCTVI